MYLVNEETNQDSIGQVLQVTVEYRTPIPTISCFLNSTIQTNLTWTRQTGKTGLPDDVAQAYHFVPYSQRQQLIWSRTAQFTDSGRYTCAGSIHGVNRMAEMNLFVRST